MYLDNEAQILKDFAGALAKLQEPVEQEILDEIHKVEQAVKNLRNIVKDYPLQNLYEQSQSRSPNQFEFRQKYVGLLSPSSNKTVTVEPHQTLSPLPVLNGSISDGWKDAIYP
jgi:hypothetical protein